MTSDQSNSNKENSEPTPNHSDLPPRDENDISALDFKIEITEVHEIGAERVDVSGSDSIEASQVIPEVPLPERSDTQDSQPKQDKKPSYDVPVMVETISMMNAKVGEPYNQQIPVPEGFFISGYGNVDDPGLHIDTVLKAITGQPTIAGTVEIGRAHV